MQDSSADATGHGGLINRNVTVNRRRTSIRLEPEMSDTLEEIVKRESVRVSDVVSRIDRELRGSRSGLTERVRVFVLGYFRATATEKGHLNAGHGILYGRSAPR